VAITFRVTLSGRDWDDNLGGWRCEALAIPSSKIEALYALGEKIDTVGYEVLSNERIVRWRGDHPEIVTVSIGLTEELSTERETQRWKRLAIILPVVATLGASIIAALAPTVLDSFKAQVWIATPRAAAKTPPPGPSQAVRDPSPASSSQATPESTPQSGSIPATACAGNQGKLAFSGGPNYPASAGYLASLKQLHNQLSDMAAVRYGAGCLQQGSGCTKCLSFEVTSPSRDPCELELHRLDQWIYSPTVADTDYYERFKFDLRDVVINAAKHGITIKSTSGAAVYYGKRHVALHSPFSFSEIKLGDTPQREWGLGMDFSERIDIDRVVDQLNQMSQECVSNGS
jgi:hypothetical protein